MEALIVLFAAVSLAVWIYLLMFRGGFWRAGERLRTDLPAPEEWPAVTALVPARDEADVVGRAVRSLLGQDYHGSLTVVVIDDQSRDGTARVAAAAARMAGATERLTVVAARPLPPGWSGKLWALSEGLAQVVALGDPAPYLWLSDADIEHEASTLRRLVVKAEAGRRDLVSLMAMLTCRGFWGRLLIPPFVFFFQMLYPFVWVNDPHRRTAAAAGGCVLIRREALERAGGLAVIRGELIDDCALGRLIKDKADSGRGGIWLGLASGSHSVRPYEGLAGIWRMVVRTAFTQLQHSPLLLVGTVIGMAVAYVVPPLAVVGWPLHGSVLAAALGLAAWLIMSVAFTPTLRLYRQPVILAPLLPLAASVYCIITADSARRYWLGKGGDWKGRVFSSNTRVEQEPHHL